MNFRKRRRRERRKIITVVKDLERLFLDVDIDTVIRKLEKVTVVDDHGSITRYKNSTKKSFNSEGETAEVYTLQAELMPRSAYTRNSVSHSTNCQ